MDELWNEINKIFDDAGKQFEKMEADLDANIRAGIIDDLMRATTIAQLRQIRTRDEFYFSRHAELSLFYENALRRVKTIDKAKVKFWNNLN